MVHSFFKEEVVYTDVEPQIVGDAGEKAKEKGKQLEAIEKNANTSKEVEVKDKNVTTDKKDSVTVVSTDTKASKASVKVSTVGANLSSENSSENQEEQPRRRWIDSQTKTREVPVIIQEARTEVIPAEYHTEYFMACSVCHIELTNNTINSHTEAHMLTGEGGGSYQSSRNILVRGEQVIQHEAVWGTKVEEYVMPAYWEYY